MGARLTERENFLRLAKGECPEWVPMYSWGVPGIQTPYAPPNAFIAPGFLNARRTMEGGYDIWGVPYVSNRETGYGALPEPNHFILDDIRKWRDVVKAPDLSGIDWEAMAKKDLENLAKMGIDRNETALMMSLHVGYFQELMALMGFTEGLCAMYEEPEEVYALLEYMCDFYCEVGEKIIDYYQPDIFNVTDDTATWKSSFISLDMYRRLIKPFHARQAEIGTRRGIPIEMHDCGKCDDFIDDWRDFGVVLWNPAQSCNDLKAVKEKYGNSLAILGGWDAVGQLGLPDVDEEFFKESIREVIDQLAPDGGFAWCSNIFGDPEDASVVRRNQWIYDVVNTYGREFYQK